MIWLPLKAFLLSKYNQPFVAAVTAAIVSQILKVVVLWIKKDERPLRALLMNGGMPSAHSALAVALLTSVLYHQGWASPTTGVAGILGILVLYDAMVVRKTMEEQVSHLYYLMERVAPERVEGIKLPRSFGHTLTQVIAGGVVGVVVAHLILWLGRLL